MASNDGFDMLLRAAAGQEPQDRSREYEEAINFLERENERLTEELEIAEKRLRERCSSTGTNLAGIVPTPARRIDDEGLTGAIATLADIIVRKGEGLPKKEPPIFKGNSFDYPVWMNTFKVLVEERYPEVSDRIYYLGRYTDGPAKEAIRGLLALNSESSYLKARMILEDRYGDKLKLAQSFREKINRWPTIKPGDGKSLRDFADFLSQCETAMKTLTNLSVLDDASEHQKILAKLPRFIQNKWLIQVDNWIYGYEECDENSGFSVPRRDTYPPFKSLCQFIAKQARIACNPLSLAERDITDSKQGLNPKLKMKSDPGTPKTTSTFSVIVNEKCVLCFDAHNLEGCKQFKDLSLSDRVSCVRRKGLCLGCFRWGHKKCDCRKKKQCDVCKRWHPTLLHDYSYTASSKNEDNTKSKTGQSATSTVHSVSRD
jgi:hypothetical protein